MTNPIYYVTQGTRIFFSSIKNRFYPKKYEGNAEQICQKVVEECWNGRYFQTSTTNFSQFWIRDFGWCTQSLLKLGYDKEVQHTLRYALNRFKIHNKITTTLTPGGRPFDFPTKSVDTLPWFIHSLKISKFPYYDNKEFLNKQITKFYNDFIDPQTGLVQSKHFSSMKDFSVRKSSCYDNCMVALLARDLEQMKLFNPFKEHDYPEIILRNFWNGEYFYDDLNKLDYVAGDANLFPFLFQIITDKRMLKSALSHIHQSDLDMPFPLKYTKDRTNVKFIWQELFMRNYESNAIWTHMGPLYIKLLQGHDSELAHKFKEHYAKQIEKHKNFLEVFTHDAKPFSSIYYSCDRGMLWAANYLTL